MLDQRAVGQQAIVEHDDRQMAQRPLQRTGEVALVVATGHQDGLLQAPSKLCAIKSTKISQIGWPLDTTMSLTVHAVALRRDHPIG